MIENLGSFTHLIVPTPVMIPIVNLDLTKNNFIFQATCIWNNLDKNTDSMLTGRFQPKKYQ